MQSFWLLLLVVVAAAFNVSWLPLLLSMTHACCSGLLLSACCPLANYLVSVQLLLYWSCSSLVARMYEIVAAIRCFMLVSSLPPFRWTSSCQASLLLVLFSRLCECCFGSRPRLHYCAYFCRCCRRTCFVDIVVIDLVLAFVAVIVIAFVVVIVLFVARLRVV